MLSFLCRHDFYWSERHRADRCRRCGHLRAGESLSATPVGNLAALLAADEGGNAGFAPPPIADPILEDWDRIDAAHPVMPADYAFSPERPAQVEAEAEPLPTPMPQRAPTLVPSVRNGGGTLLGRIEHLASGGELSRAETLDTLLALIEDGQSSDPVLFGPSAAEWYARLYNARQLAGSTVTD